MILAGAFYGSGKPPKNSLLRPVMETMNRLYTHGMSTTEAVSMMPCVGCKCV